MATTSTIHFRASLATADNEIYQKAHKHPYKSYMAKLCSGPKLWYCEGPLTGKKNMLHGVGVAGLPGIGLCLLTQEKKR